MKHLGKSNKEKNYEAVLMEAIDDALLTLGKNVQISIYFHLQTKFGLSKQEIPSHVTDFSDALEKIFGEAAKKIEILIMKFLNDRAQCDYEWSGPGWLVPNLTFEDYVSMVKATLESRKIEKEVQLNNGK